MKTVLLLTRGEFIAQYKAVTAGRYSPELGIALKWFDDEAPDRGPLPEIAATVDSRRQRFKERCASLHSAHTQRGNYWLFRDLFLTNFPTVYRRRKPAAGPQPAPPIGEKQCQIKLFTDSPKQT
jgi:hypothetical protein